MNSELKFINQYVYTLAGNSRGLGDFSWLSKTGMMSPAPVPWALYPTLSYDPTASYVKTQPFPEPKIKCYDHICCVQVQV